MSGGDPTPFSGVNRGTIELVDGTTYTTASGRKLTLMSHDDVVVFYRAEGDTVSRRAARGVFDAIVLRAQAGG